MSWMTDSGERKDGVEGTDARQNIALSLKCALGERYQERKNMEGDGKHW